MKSYASHWKQFIYYVFRTAVLDEHTRCRIYGINFTPIQLRLIKDIVDMLNEYNDEELSELMYNKEEDGDEDDSGIDEEEKEYEDEDEDEGADDEGEMDSEDDIDQLFDEYVSQFRTDEERLEDNAASQPSFIVRVMEKMFQLSIEFITQHFPTGEDPQSPITYFFYKYNVFILNYFIYRYFVFIPFTYNIFL